MDNMENMKETTESSTNDGQKPVPKAVRPVGARPRPVGARPNMARPAMAKPNEQVNADSEPIQHRDSIVDVDAENEKYFIDSMNYDDVIEDTTTRDMDVADEKKKAKEVTPEQAKKRKIIGISAGCGGALLIVCLLIVNAMRSDTGLDITKVDITGHEPVYIAGETLDYTVDTSKKQEVVEDDAPGETDAPTEENTDETTGKPEEPRVNREYRIVEFEEGAEYKLGDFISKSYTVEYKPVGAEEYTSKDTKYDCGLEAVYSGDTVSEIIAHYNETNTSNKEITIDFDSISDSTFVVIRVGCQYPEDYPTSDGKAYEVPEVDIKVVGTYIEEVESTSETAESTSETAEGTSDTESETTEIETTTEEQKQEYSNKVEANGKVYTIEAPIILHDVPNSIGVASGYNFDYLMQMPAGVTADNYKIIVTINGQEMVYTGVNIE